MSVVSPDVLAGSAATAAPLLQMIRADVDLWAFQRWAGSRGLMRGASFDEGYAMHCLLTESFGELAPKPFRLITPRDRGRRFGVLYGYGRADAANLREASSVYACPLQGRVLPAERIASKPMPGVWNPGRRLGFEVLIRPIRRSGRVDARKRERDAFQLEAMQYPPQSMPRSREAVYADWLSEQFQRRGGAQLDGETVRMTAFQRVRAVRRLGARPSEGPEAVMRGTLTITDSQMFVELLAQGVGRHRAYGYGMLLLRPPSWSTAT